MIVTRSSSSPPNLISQLGGSGEATCWATMRNNYPKLFNWCTRPNSRTDARQDRREQCNHPGLISVNILATRPGPSRKSQSRRTSQHAVGSRGCRCRVAQYNIDDSCLNSGKCKDEPLWPVVVAYKPSHASMLERKPQTYCLISLTYTLR